MSHFGFRIADFGLNDKTKTRNPQSAIRNEAGFTLLEVMVAVTIMALVLVALLGLKNRSMQDVALAEHITTATMLANAKMLDTIKLRNFNPVEEEGEYPAGENRTEYTWKRTITQIPLPNGSFLTEIHVATLWKEGTRPEMVELVDYE